MKGSEMTMFRIIATGFADYRTFLCLLLFSFHAAAAGTFGMYRSTDGGHTWLAVGRGLPVGLRVDALGQRGSHRFAGTERGIYLSSDDGLSWRRPGLGVPEDVHVRDFSNLGARAYCATSRGVWSSSDDGRTWMPVGVQLAGTNVLSLGVSGGRLYAGTDLRGIHVLTATGNEWDSVSNGLPADSQVFQFAERGGVLYVALYAKGVYRLDPTSLTWMPAGKEYPLRLVAVGDVLLSGRNPGGVFASGDGGHSWRWSALGLPEHAATWAMARTGGAVLLGTSGFSGLLRTDDAGAGWVASDWGLPTGGEAIAFGVGDSSILTVLILPD